MNLSHHLLVGTPLGAQLKNGTPPACLPRSLLARPVSDHRLGINISSCESNFLKLTLGEHFSLIRKPRRVAARAFAVGQHGKRAGHVAKLNREDPAVTAAGRKLSVGSRG